MKKKVIIIDDDPKGIELLTAYIQPYLQDLELAGKAENCHEAVQLIKQVHPDLVFLDIEMPDGSGFDVLRQVSGYDFHCIVITAFEKFAIPAFDVEALHFLCKPVGKEKFDQAILRFYKQYNLSAVKKREVSLLTGGKIKIPQQYGYDIVEVKDIVRLEARGSYTEIFFDTQKPVLVSRHLKIYERLLKPQGFVRIHKSHLINTNFVKSVHKGGVIVLKDNTHLNYSSNHKEEIFHHFSV
jgi:two-component system, LytTR family, response regulator